MVSIFDLGGITKLECRNILVACASVKLNSSIKNKTKERKKAVNLPLTYTVI